MSDNKKTMFGKVTAIIAGMMALLGYSKDSEIPINAEEKKLNFTADQIQKLKAHFGDDYFAKMQEAVDGEIKAYLDKNMDLKAIQDELDAIVKEQELTAQELDRDKENNADEVTISAKIEALNNALTAEKKKRGELEALVQKLMAEPEGDVPAAIINNLTGNAMKHSATHLFASNQSYDAFDKRPWNKRFRDGGVNATSFNDQEIPLLKGDFEHFVRQNPTMIDSLFIDTETLPSDWDYTTNVQDRISTAGVITAEIVQGRKDGWAPKNKVKFEVETGQVYRKKIDITFDGYELQELENTWIGQIKNMDGSHPWKMSFVGFLLFELSKQQKLDERIAAVNGIYSVGGNGSTPGAAVNSQHGLRYLWYYYRDIVKKYRPASIGLPTDANIVEYVEKLIMSLPEEIRSTQGLELELSDRWMRSYRNRAGEIYNLDRSTDQGKKEYDLMHPIDRPNIKFQVLKDQTQTDFMGITYSKNIRVMTYREKEETAFTFTFEKRDMHIFVDYRRGIAFKFVGIKTKAGDPKEFEKQMLWSNDVPVFGQDTKVPIFDNKSGMLKVVYKDMVVDEAWTTNIDDVEGDYAAGQVITITGNASLASAKSIVAGGKFTLAGNVSYALNTPGKITFFVNDDLTLKELSRTTTAPTVGTTDVSFEEDSINADEGTIFRFTGEVATNFDEILNGVEGKTIKIYGTDTEDATLTFADDSENYSVPTDCVLAAATHYLQLTKIAGVWTETKRVTA